MIEYSKILKDAYILTKQNLVLWFFGLFLFGGFNLGFFRFLPIPSALTKGPQSLTSVFYYFQNHPGSLALVSASILMVSFAAIIVTNWSRIMLIVVSRSILENKKHTLLECAAEARTVLWPVIGVSMLTSACVLAITLILFVPALYLSGHINAEIVVWALSSVVFLPLAFTLSALNIFTSLFIILYKVDMKKAFTQATDLFIMRWPQLLALGVILMIIYVVCFVAGVGVVNLFKFLLAALVTYGEQFKFLPISAIMLVIQFITTLLVAILVAGLNVFFNIAVLRLFLELVKPEKGEQIKQAVPAQAAA